MRITCLKHLVAAAAVVLFLAGTANAQGSIIIVNANAANVGFNDPTVVAPVGGNTGTTLGQQRLNVFNKAAAIWTGVLKPRVDVFVIARFIPLGQNVLGSAGTTFVFAGFPGAEIPALWHHSALADHLAGVDLNPGFADISASFSTNFNFYLGLDNNHGPQQDLLAVVLHELGHGLGFSNFANEATGMLLGGRADIYTRYTIDTTTGKTWDVMTDLERQASAINVRKVSWTGINVNAAVPGVLSLGEPVLEVLSPASVGPFMMVGTASFGPALTAAGLSGNVVYASPANGCGPAGLTNAAAVAGNIALIDRGTCTFPEKVKNAQNAGAMAVLIADNVVDSPPPGLGGSDPTITIPSVRITLADGNAIKAALPGVQVHLGLDLSIRAGTDRNLGLMMVAALNPVSLGSSISHFDTAASRNQLMEPFLSPDLSHSVQPPEDLTTPQMADVGWFSDADGVPDGVDACLGSDPRSTIVIGDCDSGVPNTLFTDGCKISDQVKACRESANNHGEFVSCVARLSTDYRGNGLFTGEQMGVVQACAANAINP